MNVFYGSSIFYEGYIYTFKIDKTYFLFYFSTNDVNINLDSIGQKSKELMTL